MAAFDSRKRHRAPYVVRIMISTGFLVLVIRNGLSLLVLPSIVHLSAAVAWIFIVEFKFSFVTDHPHNKLVRDFIDLLLITMFVHITGGTSSFLIIIYMGWVMGSSLYVRRLYGLFAAVISCVFFGLMITLEGLNILPLINIITGSPAPFNFTMAALSLGILSATVLINHDFVFKLYRNLYNERNELQKKNRIIDRDLQVARQIQMQIMPANAPRENIGILYRPMEELGGDFFDFINWGDRNTIGFFICDVSGHGVAPAFITSMIKMSMMQLRDRQDDPAEFFQFLNEVLSRELRLSGNFVTAWYGILDFETRELTYTSAGHNYPYIITKDGIEKIEHHQAIPMAILTKDELARNNIAFENRQIVLPEKSKLLLYTDCLPETTGSGNTGLRFVDAGLHEIIKGTAPLSSNECVQHLYRKLVEFHGSEHLEDDISLICIEV